MAQKKSLKYKAKDRDDAEKRLLEAAMEIFAEFGYEAGSTRMIARKAGINLGLISRYFGSKRGLLLAVIENLWQSMATDLPHPAQANLELELDMYLEFVYNEHMANEELLRIMLVQSMIDPTLMKDLSERPALKHMFSTTTAYLNENTVARFAKHLQKDAQKDNEAIKNYLATIDYVTIGIFLNHYFMYKESKKTILGICKNAVANLQFPTK